MKPPIPTVVRCCALLILCTAIAGCGASSGRTNSLAAAAAGLEQNEAGAGDPIVYSSFASPLPLTFEQIEEITQVAKDACPQGRELWFIHVRHHQEDRKSRLPRYRVVAYYTPDEQTPRLRKGRCAYLDNEIAPAQRRQIVAALGKGHTWPILEPYVQISAPEKPFDAPPSASRAIPSETDLPIYPPAGVSDDDLVALADAARSAHAVAPGAEEGEPLLRITIEGAIYQVDFGWQAGPSNGRGSTIKLKRTPKGFDVDGALGVWASSRS